MGLAEEKARRKRELKLFRGHSLTEWDADPRFVERAAKILKIPPEAIPWSAACRRCAAEEADESGDGFGPLWRHFPCVIPGHEGEASLYRADNGVALYHDWHDASKWFFLAEVFASQHYGHAVKFSNRWGKVQPELAVWKLRLLVETGLVEPLPGALRAIAALPSGASPTAKKVYDGFCYLLGCKWLHTHGAPTAFTYRFASAWCGVKETQARDGIRELVERSIIVRSGLQVRPPLYGPGPGEPELLSER